MHLLALLGSDPAAGILRVADLREQRARAFPDSPYVLERETVGPPVVAVRAFAGSDDFGIARVLTLAAAEHIAAEASPAHALAAVRRWRGVVERHKPQFGFERSDGSIGKLCTRCATGLRHADWPCPDLTETADEARAYLGGGS